MGARPLAIMDSLRFGPLTAPPQMPSSPPERSEVERPPHLASPAAPSSPDSTDYAKNHHVANGIVHGVAGYGNCFGVPNVGGETRFEACYSGNPLLNAFALGLVRKDEIFYAAATGVGNPVFYVGAKTGRDGIHGATMASEEFTEGSEQKRPNVQMGDPFLEKLLLEACLEVMKTGAVLGIQDMGAAGLTCSTCEMGARGELGVSIELDRVPQRETGMSSYEIMLSESQERMLLVAEKGREQEVLDVFAKWGLDCSEVGTVTADDIMRVRHHGALIAEIPNKALTDNAPVYNRPVGTWTPPVPRDPPPHILAELQKPRDYTADLLKLLASPNICDKRYIYEQFDSMVQTNTVQGPGFEAGVIRIKGTGPTPTPRPSHERSSGGPETSAQPCEAGAPSTTVSSSWVGSTPGAPSVTDSLEPREAGAPSVTDSLEPREAGAPSMTDSLEPREAGAPSMTASSSWVGSTAAGVSLEPTALITLAEKVATSLGLDPLAADHTVLGQIANFITGSTPEGVATEQTGNEDAANPVIAPTSAHQSATTPGAPRHASETWDNAPQKHERGLAMALAGNGRWCYLDPRLGAMHAVAEAARKVACTGATPVAATNCLNFGNPEKPEIMAQLSAAIDGIAEACIALDTPITGGNVSLYNETSGEGIYPTPVIGVVGILDDVTKAVPNSFQRPGDAILLVSSFRSPDDERLPQAFGSSEFARECLGSLWGEPPSLDFIQEEARLIGNLSALSSTGIVHSATDVGSGGVAVALARSSVAGNLGARIGLQWSEPATLSEALLLFGESPAFLLTCAPEAVPKVEAALEYLPKTIWFQEIGTTQQGALEIRTPNEKIVVDLTTLRAAFSNTLPSQLAAEVVTA